MFADRIIAADAAVNLLHVQQAMHTLYLIPLGCALLGYILLQRYKGSPVGMTPAIWTVAACALLAFAVRTICLRVWSQRYFYLFIPLSILILCCILDRWLSDRDRLPRLLALVILATIFIGDGVAAVRTRNSNVSLTRYARKIRELKTDPATRLAVLDTQARAAQLAWKADCAFLPVPHGTKVTDAKSAETLLAQYRCTDFDLLLPVKRPLTPSGGELEIPSGKLKPVVGDLPDSKWRLHLYRFIPEARPETGSKMGKDAVMIPHGDFDKTENANAIAWSVGAFRLTTARKICWCSHVFSPKRETRKLGYSVRGGAGARYDIILFGRGKRHSKRVLFSGCLTADGPAEVKIPLTVEDPVSEEKMQIAVVVDHGDLTIDRMYYE